MVEKALASKGLPIPEVIVIDSGSTDGTKERLSRYPVKLIEISPDSFSHGGTRNLGASVANNEILVYLTQDAIPADDMCLARLIAPLKDPDIAGTFARQLPRAVATPIEKFFSSYLYPDTPSIKSDIDPGSCSLSDIFFSDVCSAIKRSVWRAFPFNENIVMSEDQEWAKRVLISGKKLVYVPEALVHHSHHYGLTSLIKRNFDSGLSLIGVVNPSLSRAIHYELGYLRSGISFLWKRKHYSSLLLFPLYEACRVAAFSLGFHGGSLPLWVKRSMSQNKAYWKAKNI